MADAVHAHIIDALQRAAAEPGGVALFGSKGAAGLFASSSAGRQAAQRCKDEGLLRIVRTEPRGKSAIEFCTITDSGMAFLLDSANPRGVLEAMLRALDARQADQAALLDSARRSQAVLEALQANLARVLEQMPESGRAFPGHPAPPHSTREIAAVIVEHLEHWRDAGSLEDCPLPELFQHLARSLPELTVGRFHDALRELQEQGRIFLHPWTGPLYELPEPALALLAGHEIAYYASPRCRAPRESYAFN